MQQAAIDTDPRMRQFALLTTQADLRLRNISALRLPMVGVDGQGQYRSDVAHLPRSAGGFSSFFTPPNDTYDGSIRVDQRLFDPTVGAQGALERAQLAENQARVRTTLVDTQQQAMFVTFFIVNIYLLMSGLFTPVDSMAPWVRTVSMINPVRHFVTISRAILMKGAGPAEIAQPFLILLATAVLVLIVAVRQYQKRAA